MQAKLSGRAERRIERRLPAYGSRLQGPTLEVRVLNLSDEGLAVEASEKFEVGRRYRFRLLGDSGRSVPFEGVILWCRPLQQPASGRTLYRAGIRRMLVPERLGD